MEQEQREKRILVVDDQDNWRAALTSLLEQAGHDVHTIGRFEEAKEELTESAFDLIVLDVRLVDEDIFNVQGLELLQLAREGGVDSKVVILTGYPGSLREDVPEKYGADEIMLKVPSGSRFDIRAFKQRIEELLQDTEE